jgi:Na+/proline symporter
MRSAGSAFCLSFASNLFGENGFYSSNSTTCPDFIRIRFQKGTAMSPITLFVVLFLVILFGALTFLPLFSNPSGMDESR